MLENINGRDVQRKHVVSNVDKFMGTMTRWPVQNTKHITKHEVYKDIHV